MIKQHWQEQYMAAAFRSSEDEWERASSVAGHIPPAFSMPPPLFPQPYPPFPMCGYPQLAVPWGFPYPHNAGADFTFGPSTGLPGMYSHGTNLQAAFGSDFGPSPVTRSEKYHSVASSDVFRGRYQDPRQEQTFASPYVSHRNLPAFDAPNPSVSSNVSSLREKPRGEWDGMPTPRKSRPPTQSVN